MTAPITPAEFEAALRRDGYTAETRELAPGHTTPEHTHPFDVRALVLEGEITLTTAEGAITYRPGDVFTMAAGRPHAEAVGPKGVRNLAGRLHPAG